MDHSRDRKRGWRRQRLEPPEPPPGAGSRHRSRLARLGTALRPGLAVKRWLVLILASGLVAGYGFALLIHQASSWLGWPNIPGFLRAAPPWISGLLLLSLGLLVLLWSAWQWSRTMTAALLAQDQPMPNSRAVLRALLRRYQRRTGPRVVAIGGGTGMPNLLRGLRHYTDNITAVVTVADDGGSSGRLRQQMGVLPPGDFRNNIAALSDAEGLMTQLLQYRFASGDGLGGHNFGNIFITTMAAITGSFEQGIAESSRVLAVRGRILPSTLENVILCAEVRVNRNGQEEWRYVRGESRIPESGGQIQRVHLEPQDARAYPETIKAILNADLIVAGPGSFFTSLMPNLLVPAIQQAIRASRAVRLFVCNVATQPGETDGFSVSDHMRHLRLHAGDAFNVALANHRFTPPQPPPPTLEWVALPEEDEPLDYQLFTADLIDEERPWRHDPRKLAAQIMAIYQRLRQEDDG